MASKRRHQERNRHMSCSPPPANVNTISPTLPTAESTSSQPVNEQQTSEWGNSLASPMENPNDRFINESGPPTAHPVLRTQPAFIGKLYKMLEDDTQSLICWSSNGEYFSVYNSALFSKQILPQYFKHNNWQSFVRQLNMYGFSKINEMIHSNLSFENQAWDFKHPHFKRGDFQSLVLVKRKSVKSAPGPVSSHLSIPIAGPSSSTTTSPLLSHYNQNSNEDGMDGTTLPDGSSSSSSQQHPPSNFSIDEYGGVENRVMQLDQQVLDVSHSVTRLASELQDIKSLIYNQQAMIHDLNDLLRSCHNTMYSLSNTTEMAHMRTSSSVDTEEALQRTTSIPSIHSLANSLRHAANIDTSGPPPHHQHRHSHPYLSSSSIMRNMTHSSFPSYPQQHSHPPPLPPPQHSSPTTSPTSSSKSSPSRQDIHRRLHADDSQPQRRRSSHPSSNNNPPPQSQSSHPLYPILNSTLDHNNPYANR